MPSYFSQLANSASDGLTSNLVWVAIEALRIGNELPHNTSPNFEAPFRATGNRQGDRRGPQHGSKFSLFSQYSQNLKMSSQLSKQPDTLNRSGQAKFRGIYPEGGEELGLCRRRCETRRTRRREGWPLGQFPWSGYVRLVDKEATQC